MSSAIKLKYLVIQMLIYGTIKELTTVSNQRDTVDVDPYNVDVKCAPNCV